VGVRGADGFRAVQPRKKTKRREASVGCFIEVGLERPNSWGAGLVQKYQNLLGIKERERDRKKRKEEE
jgi:hypothetical protein